jgi:hypothetical protein
MPVLAGYDKRKKRRQPVRDLDDLVSLPDGERAAGTEVILEIDDRERCHALILPSDHGNTTT